MIFHGIFFTLPSHCLHQQWHHNPSHLLDVTNEHHSNAKNLTSSALHEGARNCLKIYGSGFKHRAISSCTRTLPFKFDIVDIRCSWKILAAMLVALGQGHAASKVVNILSCPHNKVRKTNLITSKLGGYIPRVMLQNWLNLGGIVLERFFFVFLANFSSKCQLCFLAV